MFVYPIFLSNMVLISRVEVNWGELPSITVIVFHLLNTLCLFISCKIISDFYFSLSRV